MKFSAQGLAQAGTTLLPPFSVALRMDPSEDITASGLGDLQVTEVARVLPGRRLSGFGTFDGQQVFAKLFYGPRPRRYWRREFSGAQQLAAAGVATPRLLASGATANGNGFFVFYEALAGAENLSASCDGDMLEAVRLLAVLHQAGCVQTDVHLGNFVRANGRAYMVDADGVEQGHLLRQQFANLALLLAQRAPIHDDQIASLWQAYAQARGEYVAGMGSAEQIADLTHRARKKRTARYLKKTQRSCTEFSCERSFSRTWLCDRKHVTRLERFAIYPEEVLAQGVPLKQGNSATVIEITIDAERYVVKRYNLKSVLHRIRRWFRRRPRNAWCNGHLLAFLEIPTARPVALLEQRWGWFTGICYLVMPHMGEQDLLQAIDDHADGFDQFSARAVAILQRLEAAQLRHGDLKATNFMVKAASADEAGTDDAEKELILIDYDSLGHGDNAADVARFLANWDDQPQLRERWQRALTEAGL